MTTVSPRARSIPVILALVLWVTSCGAAAVSPDAPPPAPHPVAPTSPLKPVGYWKAKFDETLDNGRTTATELSRSTDSWDFYTLAYSIDELASMVEATGERSYADLGLSYVENMMASARPATTLATSSYDDDFLGWTSQQNGESGAEVPLFESFNWRYVTRLLRVVRDAGLRADPALDTRYRRILAFTEVNIFDKWHSRGPDENIYRSRAHMAAHWAAIAVDLAVLTDDPRRVPRYDEVADRIDNGLPNAGSSLRGQLRPSRSEPDAYWWSDVWGEQEGAGQDVAHGNAVISYVVEAHAVNHTWTDEDLTRFARTLTAFVLGAPGRHPEYVDGTGVGNGWLADGFVKLGRVDPAVQAVLEGYDVQNSQFYAAMAANARVLGAVDGR